MNIPLFPSSPESRRERPSERVQRGASWIIGNADSGVWRIEHTLSRQPALNTARAAIESTAISESAKQIDELYERMGLNGAPVAPAAVQQAETPQNVQVTNDQAAAELNVNAIRAELDNIYAKPAVESNSLKMADVPQFPISGYDKGEGSEYAQKAA